MAQVRLNVTTGDAAGISFIPNETGEILLRPRRANYNPWLDWPSAVWGIGPDPPANEQADTRCDGWGTPTKPFQAHPNAPCLLLEYFYPQMVGVFSIRVCSPYTRNRDPLPQPVHQICFTLIGRGV